MIDPNIIIIADDDYVADCARRCCKFQYRITYNRDWTVYHDYMIFLGWVGDIVSYTISKYWRSL